MSHDRLPNILLGLTGSVATIKAPELVKLLSISANVKVVATKGALPFLQAEGLETLPVPLLGDEAEWQSWKRVGDEVLHIELRRWADLLLVAPLSANTLAKMANGLADNLLTCIVRAWDFGRPLLVAPAMNTYMWDSPFTEQHLATLCGLGVTVIAPVSKRLACGDVGQGAMAAPQVIAEACWAALKAGGRLQGQGGRRDGCSAVEV